MCGADAPEYPQPSAEERALQRAQLEMALRGVEQMTGFGVPASNYGALAYAHSLNGIRENPYLQRFLEEGGQFMENRDPIPRKSGEMPNGAGMINLPFSGSYGLGEPGMLGGGMTNLPYQQGEQLGLLQLADGTVAPVVIAGRRDRLRQRRESADGEGAGTVGIGVGGIGSAGADPAGMGPGMGW